jgi:methylthioribulose-1-phosphate dehydratase
MNIEQLLLRLPHKKIVKRLGKEKIAMDFSSIPTAEKIKVFNTLQSTYQALAQKHYFPAGCGSISMRVGPFEPTCYYFAITTSSPSSYPFEPNVVYINEKGLPCEATEVASDKEASIHAKIYRLTGCTSILHIHKPLHYEISHHFHTQSYVSLEQNEVTRYAELGLGYDDKHLNIPILPNPSQQEPSNSIMLAQFVANTLHPDIPILLGHQQGVYVWGDSLPQAIRRLEAFDFACELKRLSL